MVRNTIAADCGSVIAGVLIDAQCVKQAQEMTAERLTDWLYSPPVDAEDAARKVAIMEGITARRDAASSEKLDRKRARGDYHGAWLKRQRVEPSGMHIERVAVVVA